MKRAVSLILAAVLLSSCVACAREKNFPEDVTCEMIMEAAQSTHNPPEAEKIYTKAKENFDAYSMSLWVYGLYEECEKFKLLSDYAVYLSAGATTYEIAVLKAHEKDNVQDLVDLIEQRKKTLALGEKGMYDPEFETRMENAVIIEHGLFVIFLVTDNNSNAIKEIENLEE